MNEESKFSMIDERNIGSSFDDFLAEDGLLEISEEQALKEILADRVSLHIYPV